MANNPVNIVGFETGDINERILGTGSAANAVTTIKRSGAYALRINPNGSTNTSCRYGYPAGNGGQIAITLTANLYVSFYFYYATKAASADEPMASVLDGSSALRLEVRLDSSGVLKAYDSTATLINTGTTVLSSGTWYRIDIFAEGTTSAAYEVRIDGTTELSGTGANLGAGSNFYAQLGKQPNRNVQPVDYYYDDLWIDTTEFAPSDYAIGILKPASDATNGWTGGTAPSDYSTIDETPVSTTDYVAPPGGSAPMSATFDMQSFAAAGIPASSTIHVVKCYTYGADPSAVTNSLNVGLLSGATSGVTNNNNVGSAAIDISKIYLTNPDTSVAWTKSSLEASRLQLIENTTGVNSMRIYAGFFMVAYTATAAARRVFYIS